MRKIVSKQVLTFVLAIFMVLSIAACGTTTSPESTTAKTTTAGADTGSTTSSNEAVDPLGKYEDEITITWGIQTSAVQAFRDGDTYEDNLWSRKLKDDLNINLEVAFSADASTDAYNNKLNTLLASGDLPDIFKTQDVNVFKQALEAGYLADISGIYDEYATDSVKAYATTYADSYGGVTVDGKLYGIPRLNDNFHEAPFLWIRNDWLENLGLEAPKTIDEMVELARAFTFDDPDQNGIDDTYGLGMNKNLVNAGYANMLGLLSAFGVPAYDQNVFYRDADGKMTFSYLEPGMKDALTVLAKMYTDGLLDKEFIVKDNAVQEEDIGAGKIGMAYGNNWGTWYPYNIIYEADGVITQPYAVPTQEGFDYKVGIESNATGQITMLNANCEHPEAMIKILNLYDETVNVSTNPDNFKTYWADEQYRLCPVYTDLPGEVYASELLTALDAGSPDGLSPAAVPYYDYITGFEDGSDTSANAYGTWGQMSKSGSLPIVLNSYEPDGAMVQSILGSERPDVWVQNASVLETITITAFTDIITGVKGPEAFDTFVTDWLKAGGQQTLDELDVLYPAK